VKQSVFDNEITSFHS